LLGKFTIGDYGIHKFIRDLYGNVGTGHFAGFQFGAYKIFGIGMLD